MNSKEQTRVAVLNEVAQGSLSAHEAAGLLGVSVRQVRRILAAYRTEGVAAIAHGNRGRAPSHTTTPAIRERVITLARSTYAGVNQHHFTDLLAEREDILLSRSTVHRILLSAGIQSPRIHRMPAHRLRRERYPQEGMLLQIDGSAHSWLGDRRPRLCLLLAIDDATGTIPAALFRAQEDAQGYFLLLRDLIQTHGRPVAVYHDRHSIFVPPTQQKATLADELAGTLPMTQVARAICELGIRSIRAHSPQAKGRIERGFGTFQDRLVSELRLAGTTTPEEATAVLGTFLPRFDAQFGVPAREPGSAYRPLEPGQDLEAICSFHYIRTVAADNTVKLGEHRIQLQAGPGRVSYARVQVDIQERLDGSLVVMHRGDTIATAVAPAEAPVLRARAKGQRRSASEKDVEPTVVAAGGVGMLAASSDTPSLDDADGRQHVHAPRRPAANHPWRTYKSTRGT